MQTLNIANIAGGALLEQADIEIKKVLENIMDPNTDANKKRKVTITLEFKPLPDDNLADISFTTKSVICPARAINTRIVFEKDVEGKIELEELGRGIIQGQTRVDEGTGEIIEPNIKNRIVNIK